MRKHYITAILGIFFIAFLFLLKADFIGSGLGIEVPQKTGVSVSLGEKIISVATNAITFVIEGVVKLIFK